MIVIVSNKQKSVLDNANIDAIKDLNGLFNVQDLINNFKNYFFTKMVIDATSIVDFTNPEVLRQLASGIGSEKLVILLPPKPEPPLRFLETLVNIGIYNFSTNIDEVINLINNPHNYDSINKKIHNIDTSGKQNDVNNNGNQNIPNSNAGQGLNNINNINAQVNNMGGQNMMPNQGFDNGNNQQQNMPKNDIVSLSDFVMSTNPIGNANNNMPNMPMQNQPNMNNGMEQNVNVNNGMNENQPINNMMGSSMNINQVVPFNEVNTVQDINQVAQPNMPNIGPNPNVNVNNNANSFIGNVPQDGFVGGGMPNKAAIIGFRNVTEHAGTTTLIYKLKETMENKYHKHVALVEVGSNDLMYFRLNDVMAINPNDLDNCLNSSQGRYDYIFVDLNNTQSDSLCNNVLYLVEPSKIKINKLISQNRNIFNELNGRHVVLNKSLLTEEDKNKFSQEANLPFYAAISPFNDRSDTNALDELINIIENEKNNSMNQNMPVQNQGFLGF